MYDGAVQDLIDELGHLPGIGPKSAQRIAFHLLSTDPTDVRRLAEQVRAAYPRLDVLVNNAGGYWAHRHVTADGLEHTFALNHLAPFLLTHELRDLLVASAPARVVTVSSGAQSMGRINFDDLQGERSYSGQRAYNQSKLANVLFTTCPADNTDWVLLARDINLDVNGGVGSARGVKLRFKGVPILYAPFFSFPINDQRKSGFLTPDISDRDRTGLDLVVPYYLNLAPNYDLTLEPRYMSKRGLQLRSTYRYLLPNSEEIHRRAAVISRQAERHLERARQIREENA